MNLELVPYVPLGATRRFCTDCYLYHLEGDKARENRKRLPVADAAAWMKANYELSDNSRLTALALASEQQRKAGIYSSAYSKRGLKAKRLEKLMKDAKNACLSCKYSRPRMNDMIVDAGDIELPLL